MSVNEFAVIARQNARVKTRQGRSDLTLMHDQAHAIVKARAELCALASTLLPLHPLQAVTLLTEVASAGGTILFILYFRELSEESHLNFERRTTPPVFLSSQDDTCRRAPGVPVPDHDGSDGAPSGRVGRPEL